MIDAVLVAKLNRIIALLEAIQANMNNPRMNVYGDPVATSPEHEFPDEPWRNASWGGR